MKEEILFDKLPFLDSIQPDRRQQILKYFRTAPDSLADHLIIENLVPNRVFVREGPRPAAGASAGLCGPLLRL